MMRDISVPIHTIRQVVEIEESDNLLKAYLENGKSTDIEIKSNGRMITSTNDKDLKEYLETPIWGNLRFKVFTANDTISVRKLVEKDFDSLSMAIADLAEDIEGNLTEDSKSKRLIEKLTYRRLQMILRAVNSYKAEYFVIELNEGLLGQVSCQMENNLMHIETFFANSNEEEIQAAIKAVKLIMRRLFGVYDIDKFKFGDEKRQFPVIRNLLIDDSVYPYVVTRDQIADNLKFYLQ